MTVVWSPAGTDFTGAPPAAEQPAPVPTRPRPGGAPYATPRVRAEARARGVELPRPGVGERVRLADLAPRAAPPPDPIPAPVAGQAVLAVDVDVTAPRRDGPALTAALVQALARAMTRAGEPLRGARLGVRTEGDAVHVLPDVGDLNADGIRRRLDTTATPTPTPVTEPPEVLLTRSPAAWEVTPATGGIVLSVTAGAVVRTVVPLEHEGSETLAVRSILRLTLAHSDRVSRGAALDLLEEVRADLATR